MSAEFLFWLLILHFVGDYIIQTDWMAQNKVARWWPAWVHGLTYGFGFAILLFLSFGIDGHSVFALTVIVVTHVVIDHYRLAKHVSWFKNQIGPKAARYPFDEGMANGGYSKNTPPFMSTWLMIITDNTIHIILNFLAVVLLLTH